MIENDPRILVVDDDEDILSTTRVLLKQHFTTVQLEQNPDRVPEALQNLSFDLILLDMNFTRGKEDGSEGLDLLEKLIRLKPGIPIIMMTAYGEIHLAVEAMKRGAADFILKPWRNEELLNTIRKATKGTIQQENPLESPLIGTSKAMEQVLTVIQKVAPTDANVLITGENGTGKTMVAELIHKRSHRSERPFVLTDLGAIPEKLFESELFGHAKGAFTDAKAARKGKFEEANGGSIFLDEIGNIPLPLQSKLLSVLQQRQVQPIGSNTTQAIDVRLIAATNQSINEMASRGDFRQDLLYRINTIEITLPPLRDRTEDIPALANHFINQYGAAYGKESITLDKSVLSHLTSYSWPGNIRELQHSIERAVIMADDQRLTLADFSLSGVGQNQQTENLNLKANEKRLIVKALEENGGNITHAARALGIDRLALYRRMEKYGL